MPAAASTSSTKASRSRRSARLCEASSSSTTRRGAKVAESISTKSTHLAWMRHQWDLSRRAHASCSEVLHYAQTWLDHIEADPRGGTIGGLYRAVLYAINSRPLMAAIMRRDRRIFGNYLRKPDNLFASMQSASMSAGFLQALQEVGAVRKDVAPLVMANIMDMLSYGLVTIEDFRRPDELPAYDVVIEAIAYMMDRLLTPEGGGNSARAPVFPESRTLVALDEYSSFSPKDQWWTTNHRDLARPPRYAAAVLQRQCQPQ
jgi:hypothetical protein